MSYIDSVIERSKTDPIGAGVDLTKGLMRFSPSDPLRQGYTLGSALISAQDLLGLDARQTAVVAEKVVDPLYNAAQGVVDSDCGALSVGELVEAVAEFGYRLQAGWAS